MTKPVTQQLLRMLMTVIVMLQVSYLGSNRAKHEGLEHISLSTSELYLCDCIHRAGQLLVRWFVYSRKAASLLTETER